MAATHEFVSRAEILEYRTVTTLLQYTDVAKSNPDSERSGYRTPKPEQGIWERLNHFVNLLVREHEVVAILASGGLKSLSADVALIQQTPHLGGGQGEHNDDDDDNNWLGTLSPHR